MSVGGKRPGSGRKKGVPNKINSDIKALIIGALQEGGGQDWLVKQMDLNPVAFMGLIGRVLPMTVTGDPNGAPISIAIVSGVPRAEHEPEVRVNGHAAPSH